MAASLATELSASGIPMYQSGTLPPHALSAARDPFRDERRGTGRLLASVEIAIATLHGVIIGGAWSGI
jgi:hypothetical protein